MSAEGVIEHLESDDRDYEAEARSMGWHPKEDFRGNAEDWVDAKTFIRRGEEQLPIMRENNRKLMTRVRRAEDDNSELRTKLDALQGSIDALRKLAETANEAGYRRAVEDLKAKQRQAVREGDEATFDRIQEEINQAEKTHKETTTAVTTTEAPPKKAPAGVQGTPEFKVWFSDNQDWILKDQTLVTAATEAERELRNSDEPYSEAEIWDQVTEMVKSKFPRRFAAATGSAPPPTAPRSADGAAPRRAPTVLPPSGGAPSSRQPKTGIEGIQDPEERKAARVAFNRIKASIPDYTESEYMKAYTTPNYDSISPAIERKAKANGTARA